MDNSGNLAADWANSNNANQHHAGTQSPNTEQVILHLQVRTSLATIYPVFIMMNSVVFLLAIPFNSYIIIKTVTTKEARNSRVLHFLTNAAVCDLFKLIFVLPITLANLLLENFVFGSILCYALPMLQVFPVHASIITYAGLTYDRYRGIRYPDVRGIPPLFFTVASWLLAFCSVLPYTGSITYIDLEPYKGPLFQNLGLCLLNLEKHIQNFLRATFFLLFLIPALVIMYLLMRTSWELNFQRKVTPAAACVCDEDCVMRKTGDVNVERMLPSPTTKIMGVDCLFCTSELQWKDQRRITIITTLFILSWTPINIFILATHFMSDSTEEHSSFLDITHLSLTWLGFLSTCFNPFIMYLMLKDRVEMYKSCHGVEPETVQTTSRSRGTPSPGPPSRSHSRRPSYNPTHPLDAVRNGV